MVSGADDPVGDLGEGVKKFIICTKMRVWMI